MNRITKPIKSPTSSLQIPTWSPNFRAMRSTNLMESSRFSSLKKAELELKGLGDNYRRVIGLGFRV